MVRLALFIIYISAIQLCLKQETSGDSCGEQLQALPGVGDCMPDLEGGFGCSSDDASRREIHLRQGTRLKGGSNVDTVQ